MVMEYGKTLNLPETEFPMRGNLPQREPEILQKWQELDIYNRVQAHTKGLPKFVLHDGPPYANGNIHTGHVMNKVLKDIIVKYKSMAGFDAPYVPGWDTHGLPVEQRAIKELGINQHSEDKAAFRAKCEEFALSFVDTQREQFKRLGVRGDWEHPYITLQKEFEAIQIGAFGEMVKKGYIYKGKKPVYWCADCETALAEAEVEYADVKSPAIYVKFPVKDGKGLLPAGETSFLIWTTTPWTIPANLAICIHADYVYADIEISGHRFVMAKELIEAVAKDAKLDMATLRIIREFKGAELEGVVCTHPLLQRDSIVILGDHVTLDAGCGCVHTAPGHGVEDFEAGRRYGLPVLSVVDDKGYFNAEAGKYAGQEINAGGKEVVKDLDACGALLALNWITHAYPHCWRCKHPIIFRATEQWFCSIEGFREQALHEIDNTQFIPAWGHDRIYNMVKDRSDWCISRQRTWGVPIPIFYCEDCGKELVNDATISHIQKLFAEYGSNVWFEREAKDLIPEGLTCECGCHNFRKETDIMDVWFDSGSSHLAVLETRPELTWPADLYLEGSDQHRGWFNSSLNIGVACRGKAPYKAVLTHGFLVDEKGRKMSKSLGNTLDPLEIINKMGADVLRLWVSSADYRSDLAISNGILKQVSETYRKIRNTARFLLSNLNDFDPAKDALPYAELAEIDRWQLHRLQKLIGQVRAAYDAYEFHGVYHAIHHFCVVEMSNLYLDITKDTLYAELPDDRKRRSVQTVMYKILDALVRLITPILAFTSEEIFQYMPKVAGAPESVQLLAMPEVDPAYLDDALDAKWQKLAAVKEQVAGELELARQAKAIGHSLDAAVTLTAGGESYQLLEAAKDELAHLFIVSQCRLQKGEGEAIKVSVEPAKGIKCARCWIYSEEIGHAGEHAEVCPRCAKVLAQLPELPEE